MKATSRTRSIRSSLLAGAAAAAVLSACGGGHPISATSGPATGPAPTAAPATAEGAPSLTSEASLTTLVPRPPASSASIRVASPVNSMVVGTDGVWVGSPRGIARIDPLTNTAGPELAVPNVAGFFAFGFGSAWVSDWDASLVRRLDPTTGNVLAEIPVGDNPEGIASTDGAVWVANHRSGSVSKIDPTTNTVVATLHVAPAGPGGPQTLLASDGGLWVSVPNMGAVLRINTASGTVGAEVHTSGDPCGEMELLDGNLWVAGCAPFVYVVDPTTSEEIDVVALGAGLPGRTLSFGDRVWIPESGAGSTDPGRLLAVGPSFEIEGSIEVEANTFSAVAGFGSLWIGGGAEGIVRRFEATAIAPD